MLEENVGSPQGNEQQTQNFAHDNLQNNPAGQAAEDFTQTKTTHREMDKKIKNIVLVVSIIISALIVAILIVSLINKSSQQGSDGQDDNEDWKNDISVVYDDILTEDNEEEVTEGEIAIIEQGTAIPEIIDVYQKYIDEAENDERKVGLYNARIRSILEADTNKEYGQQVIDDAIEIDRIVHSISTAAQVWNYASSYGFKEIMQEYQDKIEKRSEELNIDTSAEVQG